LDPTAKLERAILSARLAPLLPRREYSGPEARASNELQRVNVGAGVYLKHRRYR
jgi:hypothetical protein